MKQGYRPLFRAAFGVALPVLACLLLGACNYSRPAITQQSQVVMDAEVDRSRLNVLVRPVDRLHTPVKALLYPMWIREQLPRRLEIGHNLARVFHGAWTERPVFPTLVLPEDLVYRGREVALREARQRGAEMVVLLTVPYLYAGGTVDDTVMTIRCDIYDAASGMLINSMEQSGRVAFERNKDWILWVTRTRMPDSPLYSITRAIAEDMAVPLRSWLPPVDLRSMGFAGTSDEIVAGLTGTRDHGGPAGEGGDGMGGASAAEADMQGMDLADELAEPAGGSVYIKVEFDVDKATIRPEYYPNLDELARALMSPRLRDRKVLLIGHTDSDASEGYNLDLSRRRSASVKRYLTERHGIEPARLKTEGRGESEPLVPNSNAANKQLNRRVEVRLLPQ